MFNYARAKEQARAAMSNPKLQLIVLGHSGSGKSFCIGTMNVKTLYLYGMKESHGPKSASTRGSANIEPMCIDYGIWGDETVAREWTSDESYQFLEGLLKDHKYLKSEGYEAIALDGLSVLESIIKDTTLWATKCKSANGKHNSFKESEASQELMGNVITWLKAAQREIDCHVVVTGIIDVKAKDQYGGVEEAIPRLGGYGLCESLIQHFADVTVIGKMARGGETKYKFQFLTDLAKVAKDEHGTVKKSQNFAPRITGIDVPSFVDADLSILADMKAKRPPKV